MPDVAPVLIDGAWMPARAAVHPRDPEPRHARPRSASCADCGPDGRGRGRRGGRARRSRPGGGCPASKRRTTCATVARQDPSRRARALDADGARDGKPLIEAVDCIEWVAACFDYYARGGRAAATAARSRRWPRTRSTSPSRSRTAWSRRSCRSTSRCCSWPGRWRRRSPRETRSSASRRTRTRSRPCCMARCFDGLPPGVVNVVTGGPETGEALVRPPGRRPASPSPARWRPARRIAAQAGQELKKVNLELGSMDPLIVFEDADLDVAVPGRRLGAASSTPARSAPRPSASTCVEPIARRVHRAARRVRRAPSRVGDPMRPGDRHRPADLRRGARRASSGRSAQAVREGARAARRRRAACSRPGSRATSWPRPSSPTCRHGSLPTTEEIFGPVALAHRRAGRGRGDRAWPTTAEYGLGANVYTNDLETAMRAMQEIKAGHLLDQRPADRQRRGPVRRACAGAASAASSARRGWTRSASPSTSTWTTSWSGRPTGTPTAIGRFRRPGRSTARPLCSEAVSSTRN